MGGGRERKKRVELKGEGELGSWINIYKRSENQNEARRIVEGGDGTKRRERQ